MTMLPMKRDPMQQQPFPRRGGLFGASPAMQPAMTAEAAPMTPKKGFDWKKLIGVLGDSLSIAGGGRAQYVPNLIDQRNRQQAQQYAEQTYQRRRGDDMQDWQAKQEIEAKYRPPTYFDDNAGNRWAIGADGKPALAFRDPTLKYTQQVVTDPDGSQRLVPVPIPNNVNPDGTFSAAPIGGAPQPPAKPIGKLTPYGGGQTATPSGNFR